MISTPERVIHVACLGIFLATTGLGVAISLAPQPKAGTPLVATWQRRCTQPATLYETSVVPASPAATLALGGIPMGPYGIKVETRSICQAETWECPTGRTCDAASRPDTPSPPR